MLLCLSLALADTGGDLGGEPPVADAGVGLLANVGDTVALNGRASADPEGEPLTFTWTQVGGPPVELEKADSPEPQFTIEAGGTMRFSLVVNDGAQDSAPDTVEIVAPEGAFGGEAEGGCQTVPAPYAAAALAFVGLALRRR